MSTSRAPARRAFGVNAVAPGITDTPMLTDFATIRDLDGFVGLQPLKRKSAAGGQANALLLVNSHRRRVGKWQSLRSDGDFRSSADILALR